MKIGLLGMSGVGKTFWATRLAAAGFKRFPCDDLIAAQLRPIVRHPLTNLLDVGAWMGLPYEAEFSQKENLYLTAERQVLLTLASELAQTTPDAPPIVVDLTGSAIYAGEDVWQKLRATLVLVYLALTPAVHETMLEVYLRQPRPLIWRGLFQQAPDEPLSLALRQSYTRLIAYREQRYEQYGDIKIEYAAHRRPGLMIADFLKLL